MKTAYEYLRISDDDQSHFSIEGQKKMITEFANRHNYQILDSYTDDGYSAKDFNRPSWKELEKMLAKNKHKVDYLIVWKYDRLIRNVAEGFSFIEKLEKKWNIILLSVLENFGIDPESPYFFKHRADLLVGAEFERRMIADRTKMGIWSAKDSGRFIGKAPVGYKNARDEEGKPILLIDKEKSDFVAQIFDDFLNGYSYPLIRKRARQNGIIIKGHEGIQRLISNHTYAGLVPVPKYYSSKPYIKQGLHEGIVPVEKFWKAYYKLKGDTKPQGPKIVDSNVPLRGFLICQCCNSYHTGGKSKGRSAYYYYYRCKKCAGENYNAIKVHEEMTTILNALSLKENYIQSLMKEVEVQFLEENEAKATRLKRLKAERKELRGKLDSLEEKYIANRISQ
ncbi:MAG: recombinase family protein, partial [Bacteroidia bacterium]